MFRRFFSLAWVLLLLGATTASSQDFRSFTSLNEAIRNQWVQFNLVAGRIVFENPSVGTVRNGRRSLTQKEQFALVTQNGKTKMTYEWSNSKEELTIEATADFLQIRRWPKKDNTTLTPVEFRQKPDEMVFLLGPAEKQQSFSGQGLWHLFVLYPEEMQKHVAPLLQLLQPKWKLNQTAASIEKELLKNSQSTWQTDSRNWDRWIAQLGDDSFAKREAADRSLRTANPALLFYLQRLDFSTLDAEQQFRLRRILDTLTIRIGEDTPEQVASWLAGDPTVWLGLLKRPEVSTRQLAAKHLTGILDGPIPVDPEAEPDSQKEAYQLLRTRVEGLLKSGKKE